MLTRIFQVIHCCQAHVYRTEHLVSFNQRKKREALIETMSALLGSWFVWWQLLIFWNAGALI